MVFDKFHVVQNANKAVDQVRRAEVRTGAAGVWDALRQTVSICVQVVKTIVNTGFLDAMDGHCQRNCQ